MITTAVDAVGSWFQTKDSTLKPGPYAGDSIPARGPQRDFSSGEREQVNEIGRKTGCHTCGTTTPGTRTGNFVPDHQPPTATNTKNDPQRLYPHCVDCSRKQGGEVRQAPKPRAPNGEKEPEVK
jgi:general stress protein YciG